MSEMIDKEKSMEVLLERLIMMVGKANERTEQLHQRVLQLEFLMLEMHGKKGNNNAHIVS